MRSMFASVSGLKAHQSRMDVIGNNIANVNTLGFRASRVTFKEVFSQTLEGAGAPDANTGRGGTNPIQIGLGMALSAVDTITTSGSLQRTDSPTDLSIEGNGFLIVRPGESDTFKFTRAGNFSIDKLGNIVGPGGMNVYGWQKYSKDADNNIVFDTQETIKPLNIFEDDYNLNKRIIAAKQTSSAVLAGNLDATENALGASSSAEDVPAALAAANAPDPQFIVPMTVYDALGNEYKINVNFWKDSVTGGQTSWYWKVGDGSDYSMSTADGYVAFDSNGKIITNDEVNYNVEPLVTLTPADSVGSGAVEINLDFNKLTMYSSDSSVKPTSIDGYAPGELVTFNIGSDGIMTGIYSNGRQQPLGLVAVATFENPAGMQRAGNNLFLPTTNSGDFKKPLTPGTEGAGVLNPGTLEMSNVDLAQQFTEMIVTQRGFQANSRIMTSADEMLQELANMKR